MESFLRRKLAQAGGNILGGSSLQKPVSSYQFKLPDLSSSFYSIADEPFPQVSGFLDDTVSPSFISSEAGTVLNTPACTPSEKQRKNKVDGGTNDSVLNCSLGAPCQLAGGSTSIRSQQNEKDIIIETTEVDAVTSLQSPASLEKSGLISVDLKNSTFDLTQDLKDPSDTGSNDLTQDLKDPSDAGSNDLTQDLKDPSDTGSNANLNLHNMREKNGTFDLTQDSKDRSDTGSNATADLHNIKEKNSTFDVTQDSKELSDTGINRTVDLQNIKEKNSTFDLTQDSKEPSDSGANATVGLQNIKEKNSTFESQEPEESPNPKLNSTVDIYVPNVKTEPGNITVELVQSHDPKEGPDTRVNATVEIPNVESTDSRSSSPVGNSAPLNTTTEQPNEMLEGTIDMQPQERLHGSENSSEDDKIKNTEEANLKVNITIEEEQTGSAPIQAAGDISRNGIFCLDDTLNMRTSFMFTSTPIVFGKESRFEILRDVKPTPMRKRLSVINSMEAQSNDEIVCASNNDGTDATQATERSSQKVSATCTSSNSASEPANENKPPTKPPLRRRLPQLSSKLSYPKSSLPPRLQSSLNSSIAVKPKTVPKPQAPQQPNTSNITLLGNRKTVQMNKGKNIAPVKNTASASTVKTSMVSSVTGYNFTAVAKPLGSGLLQMKPSGLQPPSRKRPALKTPQTTQSPVETIQTQPSNKPTGVPGMRTRNSLLPSVGQKRLNNDGLPSAKRKRIAPAALSTVETDAVHPVEGPHGSAECCINCLQHQEKLERVLQELMVLRSECKNWGPLQEKLEMCVEEMKRI